jgi:hypothetical protein
MDHLLQFGAHWLRQRVSESRWPLRAVSRPRVYRHNEQVHHYESDLQLVKREQSRTTMIFQHFTQESLWETKPAERLGSCEYWVTNPIAPNCSVSRSDAAIEHPQGRWWQFWKGKQGIGRRKHGQERNRPDAGSPYRHKDGRRIHH